MSDVPNSRWHVQAHVGKHDWRAETSPGLGAKSHLLLSQNLYAHLAVISALQNGMAQRHGKVLLFPKAFQRINDTLPGAFTDHGRGDVTLLAQIARALQKYKMIDTPLFHDLTLDSRKSIGQQKESVHISFGILVEFSVNRKCAATHAVLATFREESGTLLWCESGQSFLETFKPIRQIHIVFALIQ